MAKFAVGVHDGRSVPGRAEHTVRVSFSALVKLGEDGRYVLFHTPNRPGVFSPPGGVFKYFEPAALALEAIGFRPENVEIWQEVMRRDLRGFLPAHSLGGFRSWFASGAYREDSAECLRRELIEELGEVGFPELAAYARGLVFTPVGTTWEGPHEVPGRPYRQVRRFEVHELVPTAGGGARLHRELLDRAADPSVETIVAATIDEIAHGRVGRALVAPHTSLLLHRGRLHSDIPPIT
jgi:SMODS-associated NUDIX domain